MMYALGDTTCDASLSRDTFESSKRYQSPGAPLLSLLRLALWLIKAVSGARGGMEGGRGGG